MIQFLKDLFTTKPEFKVGDLVCFEEDLETEGFEPVCSSLVKVTHVGKKKYGFVYHYYNGRFGDTVHSKEFDRFERIYVLKMRVNE